MTCSPTSAKVGICWRRFSVGGAAGADSAEVEDGLVAGLGNGPVQRGAAQGVTWYGELPEGLTLRNRALR